MRPSENLGQFCPIFANTNSKLEITSAIILSGVVLVQDLAYIYIHTLETPPLSFLINIHVLGTEQGGAAAKKCCSVRLAHSEFLPWDDPSSSVCPVFWFAELIRFNQSDGGWKGGSFNTSSSTWLGEGVALKIIGTYESMMETGARTVVGCWNWRIVANSQGGTHHSPRPASLNVTQTSQ